MEKIRLGKTELVVSEIGFGGIPIQTPPEEAAVALVRESLDLGVNFIDTSRMYTCSEERIGKAIKGRRSEVVLATKSALRTGVKVREDLEQSLKNLQTDYVDLYQFHNVSTPEDLQAVLVPGGPLEVVQKARQAGAVLHIGITSHRLTVAREAIMTDLFETVMIGLNFVNTEAAEEILPLARARDVGVIVMKPMAGGMLEKPVLAFKYLLQFSGLLTLIGIARPGEMAEIIKIVEAGGSLTEADLNDMDRIRAELGNGFCRMCNYCQPCPQQIMISAIMYTQVALTRFAPERIFKGEWDKFMAKIDSCIDCGECEKRCPYELPIRNRIREAGKQYAAAKNKYLGLSGAGKPINR
ncbi:MAG: aldo/keto reductase [Pseudomonadota bacterium]